MRPTFDERDAKIRERNLLSWNEDPGPRTGDYVIFANGVKRRISYVWRDDYGRPELFQTSSSGSWYFGNGYCSFSGQLFRSVKATSLVLTESTEEGHVWFFHHDYAMAHHGVDTNIPCRVYTSTENAPE